MGLFRDNVAIVQIGHNVFILRIPTGRRRNKSAIYNLK